MNVSDMRSARKVVWGSRVSLAVLISALIVAGCGRAGEGRGPSVLVLDALTGASGADPDTFSNVLASDVLTFVKSGTSRIPTTFEDPGQAAFHVTMKDIKAPTTPVSNITLTRYHVVYVRADGKNRPGIDVPYAFDGAITETITPTGGTIGFTLVRANAKNEAPLLALVGSGGTQYISAIAQVTFYGTDGAGNTVSVTGQMSITFADWGDPA